MDACVRKSLRLLPLPACIALSMAAQIAHAADDRPQDWKLCPVQDAVPAFADAQQSSAIAGARVDQPTDIEGDQLSGTEASRQFLANVWFDESRCSRLIDCMDSYRREWDDKWGVWKNNPVHDEYSHGYKSFESAAIRPVPQTKPAPVSVAVPSMRTAFNRSRV